MQKFLGAREEHRAKWQDKWKIICGIESRHHCVDDVRWEFWVSGGGVCSSSFTLACCNTR